MIGARVGLAGASALPKDTISYRWIGACMALACVWSLTMLAPVLLQGGWPANHDGLAPVFRMAAILGQWEAGHPLPVWSTAQQFGYGSPMPALYHKTHMLLSALALAVTGSVKAALVLPLFLLMVLGFCGMCFALRHALQGRHPWLWCLGGASLLASNYATVDWVVRGAFAEFGAMMLIPWVLAWCFVLVGEGRWPLWIGPLLAVLALTHSSVALFVVLPLGLALLAALMQWPSQVRSWWVPAVWSMGLAALILLPFVLPMLVLSRFSRVERLAMFTPASSGFPWSFYFWDPHWTWGADWQGMTVQLDFALLLLLPVYVAFVFAARGLRSTAAPWQWSRDRRLALVLLGTLLVMGGLQLRAAAWMFGWIPGGQYLQFAWRLSVYLTVVLIVCGCIALSWLAQLEAPRRRLGRQASLVGALLVLLWGAYPKMWWNWKPYPWYAPQTLEQELRTGDYTAFGEFFPRVDWPPPGPAFHDASNQMADWLRQLPPQTCKLSASPEQAPRERRGDEWLVDCPVQASVFLPLFWAPGTQVFVRHADSAPWQAIAATRSCADPRAQLLLPAGPSALRVKYPSWARMVKAGLLRQGFDYPRDCPSGR